MLQPVAALPVDADLLWITYLRGALVGRLESWASTEQDATNLANLIVALALKAPRVLNDVTQVLHLSGPNSVADPSGQPRRLALIEATHRVTLLT
jgi:hypothetical protein